MCFLKLLAIIVLAFVALGLAVMSLLALAISVARDYMLD